MKSLYLLTTLSLICSCSSSVTPDEAIATAYRYTQVEWMPQPLNIRHGPDSKGIPVQTPDTSLAGPGGWWKPGVPAKSMPYQWGGFDTPESFLQKIANGKKAGDIANSDKRNLGDAATSLESCGIDCSGFVSRCWKLPRAYSTKQLPTICIPLSSWNELRKGDILLNNKHVVLFVSWKNPNKEIAAYEAGPLPCWRVSACGLLVDKLKENGYSPWRYKGMAVD